MNNKELINKVFQMLGRQKFADWYNSGRFDRYITGDMEHEDGLTNEQCIKIIHQDISNFLQIEDKD